MILIEIRHTKGRSGGGGGDGGVGGSGGSGLAAAQVQLDVGHKMGCCLAHAETTKEQTLQK